MATVVFPEISEANNAYTYLDGAISNSATTINIDSAAALGFTDSTTDAYITIIDPSTYRTNPVSGAGETLEICQVTAVSTNQLTVTRGVDGTSGTTFPDNSIVEVRIVAAMLQRPYDALTDGTDDLNINALVTASTVTAASDTDTTHTFGRSVMASHATDQAYFSHIDHGSTTAYAFKQNNSGATFFNAASGQSVGFRIAQGLAGSVLSDKTLEWNYDAQFDTNVNVDGEISCIGAIGCTTNDVTGDGTTTIDWGATGNYTNFQFGAFNETFTFTAPTNPGYLAIKLVQDSVGSRTATWPAAVKWPGGTAPTLTTTATTGTDVIRFYFDGTNYFGTSDLNYS